MVDSETRFAGLRLSQTTAIINYIAKKAGPQLEGTPGKQYAVSQMLIAQGETLYGLMQKMVATKYVPQSKKDGLEAFDYCWASVMPPQLQHLEVLLGGAAGTKNAGRGMWSPGQTAGELYLFSMLHQMVLVKPTCLDATPLLKQFYTSIAADSRTKEVLGGQSPYGELGQYFVDPRAVPKEGSPQGCSCSTTHLLIGASMLVLFALSSVKRA